MIHIDDGDIGYTGMDHISFRRASLPDLPPKQVTEIGEASCEVMRNLLSKYKLRSAKQAYRAIDPMEYQRAVSRIFGGKYE